MKLSDWLNEKGMSPAVFADRIGYARSTVGRWLDDKAPTMPRRDARAKIKEATDGAVLPSDFMDDDEDDASDGGGDGAGGDASLKAAAA